MEGRKDDYGKLPWHLLPADAMDEILRVLDYGQVKYSARNWEQGMSWSRPFSALMRHMWSWWRGQNNDPETNISHLAHAGCCILFLLAYHRRGVGQDDRPNGTASALHPTPHPAAHNLGTLSLDPASYASSDMEAMIEVELLQDRSKN